MASRSPIPSHCNLAAAASNAAGGFSRVPDNKITTYGDFTLARFQDAILVMWRPWLRLASLVELTSEASALERLFSGEPVDMFAQASVAVMVESKNGTVTAFSGSKNALLTFRRRVVPLNGVTIIDGVETEAVVGRRKPNVPSTNR